jgi:hypothetical protein
MSPHVPTNAHVAKGAVCYALDQVSKGPRARERLRALKSAIDKSAPTYKGLADTFDKHLLSHVFTGAAARKRIVDHLKHSWFEGGRKGYFPGTPVARIYGEGVSKTLDLALKGKGRKVVPIDSWWSLDHSEMKMVNLADVKGNRTVGSHVTLMIHTPKPKGKGKASGPAILGDSASAHVTHRSGGSVGTRRIGNIR